MNQTKGLKRNTTDKFYTKESTANMCIDLVQQNLQINRNDLIIEPSAGNGSFIPGIKQLTDHYVFYDIEPEHTDILPQDYLVLNRPALEEGRRIHVIGNPPFGRQSSLAIQFIKKSCEFCHTLSFILPKSFKKDSLQKTFPLSFHRVYETDIPNRSFLVNGQEHDVPCVFQIWEKRDASRAVCEKKVPRHFIFVSREGPGPGPDISFRRVGVNAGTIDVQTEGKSVQSHYFIRFTNGKSVDENRKKIADIKFEENNTVGPKSISKQELISRFNDCLDSI